MVHSCKLNNLEGKFEIGLFQKKLLSSLATARDFVCVSGFVSQTDLFCFFSLPPPPPFFAVFQSKQLGHVTMT